jgi:hypothetical protein
MAHKLRTFDFRPTTTTIPASEKFSYPWEDWLDGDIWQIEQGADFERHPLMMERIIRTRATARGAKIRMRHLPSTQNGKRGHQEPFGTIVFQRTDIIGPTEFKERKAASAAKRAAKKAAAERDAHETLAKAGIKPRGKATKKLSKRPARLSA